MKPSAPPKDASNNIGVIIKPYVTKVWWGKHWRYVHTRRSYKILGHGRFGAVSYKRVTE